MTSKTEAKVANLLINAAIATVELSAEQKALNEKREGAYVLYVKAGIEARKPEVLESASESLFAVIRATGAVPGPDGKPVSLNCKANKAGDGFTVPSALSAAKSYILNAMTRGIALKDDKGTPRAFTAIRKDVMSAQAEEAKANATGDDAMRYRARDLLGILAQQVADRKGEALARTVKAIEGALRAAQPTLTEAEPESKGDAIAQAA